MLQPAVELGAGVLPAGLLQLRGLAHDLASRAGSLERNLRVVVTVPTLRLAGAAAALGAVLAELDCSRCPHRQLEVGTRVTGWASGKFTDATLAAMTADELLFAGIRLRGSRDTVHRLPANFPERGDTRLPDPLRAELAAAYGCAEVLAGQRLSAACAHPVVVIGERSAFGADVELLAAAGGGLHARALLHAGARLRDWFRDPVLATGPLPEPEEAPWATALRPRLVVVAGSTGWVTGSRRLWPDVPVLVLLARRSPAATEVAATITASGWATPSHLPASLTGRMRPGAGLEFTCVVEPDSAPVGEDLW